MAQIKTFGGRSTSMILPIEEKYKLSKYNVFYQNGNVQYIWNTYSDALLELSQSGQEYICSFSGTDDESDDFELLKTNGFIIYEQIDEFGRACLLEKQTLFTNNPSNLTFVIAPGMKCNYRCNYCFQKTADKMGIMTPEIAEKVAEYICCQLERNPNIKRLRITWFGGEPLLYVNIIGIISRKLIEYTQKNKIKYIATIITNGRFLDAKNLSLLKEYCVEAAQITVDGHRDSYCKSKGASLKDFYSVINNIYNAADTIKISVRLNIPDNNADEAILTTDYLLNQCNLLGKVIVYFACVRDYSSTADVSQQSYIKYVQNYFKWLNHMIENYDMTEIKTAICNRKSRTISCGLITPHNICIGPRGEFYKCEHNFGDNSMIIGNVWQGRFYNGVETCYYTTIDHPSKYRCSQCEYLPVCMGECTNDWLSGFIKIDCNAYKQLFLKLKLLEGGVRVRLLDEP